MANEPYYAATAYTPYTIPQQVPSNERSWIMRFAKARLPWGSKYYVLPANLAQDYSPHNLREQEQFKREDEEQIAAGTYSPSPYEKFDFHFIDNHECLRHALLPASSHFWIYMKAFGRVCFFYSYSPVFRLTS